MGIRKKNNKPNNIISKMFDNINNSKSFKINGLIFDSEEDYKKLKNIDDNINNIVHLVKNGIIDINDVMKSIDKIYVEETYYDAGDELDGLFRNATGLLMYEDTPYNIEYKIGCKFFDKIDVEEYDE